MAESLSESPPQQGPMCPVCFRDYSDSDNNLIPRILQCGHTYCTGEDLYYMYVGLPRVHLYDRVDG
jgi:hypothetical protein